MEANEFNKKLAEADDSLDALDFSKAKDQKRVNVGFPAWMIESLGKEAGRIGVARQSIIKI